ncbi:MAG TPA: hypothetical protein VFL15_10540, partial [Gammaproteobacteria bacterium]|nr:hypothetical protein [Gammaproteobacteria bacterium]
DAPDIQAQLGNYLINHNEMTSSLSQATVLPYFYVATYDPHSQAITQPLIRNSQPINRQDKRNRR